MKNKLLAVLAIGMLFISCEKEMKISRLDHTVTKEVTDFSPVYIDKNEKGEVTFNQANRIGNTHWILTINRELTLAEILPALQELTHRKYEKESAHEDTKDIYLVYSDTLNQQNAFVKLPFKYIKGKYTDIDFHPDTKYLNKIPDLETFKSRFLQTEAINEPFKKVNFQLAKEMSVEEFTAILVACHQLNIAEKIDDTTHIF